MFKKLTYILVTVIVLIITDNVSAHMMNYNSFKCGDDERWSPSNGCKADNGTELFNVISIDYVDGNVLLRVKADAFDEDEDSMLDQMTEVIENRFETVTPGNICHYDVSFLENYYKKSGRIPNEIVVVESYDSSGALFYFGVSELELLPISGSDPHIYYFSYNNQLNEVYACNDLVYYKQNLRDMATKYGANDEDVKYESERLLKICDTYLGYNEETDNTCYSQCNDLKKDISNLGIDVFNMTNSCGIGERMIAWLVRILKLLRFIVPILVIVLSTFEYVSAFMSNDDDAFKKAGGRFGKRLFIMILFFTLPSILQFVFNVFNVDGLSSSNPYCLKWK